MNPFQKLAAKAQSARFRFKADVDKGDLIDGEKQTGGLKVMTVVIFVLAAHIVVIGGITAYNLLKGPPKDTAQTAAPSTDGLATDGDKTDGTDKTADAAKPADADTATNATATKDDGTATTASATAPAANDASSSEAINLAPATANGDNGAPDAATAPATQAPGQAQGAPASKPLVQATVPPVAVPAPALAPAPVAVVGARQSYVVKSGDNLHKIAVSHGMTVAQLKAVNGLKGDMIRVGQKLTVVAKGAPAVAVAQAAPAAPATPAAAMVATIAQATPATPGMTQAPAPALASVPAGQSSQSYKVAKGDTLTRIAKQFKTTASAIMAANKLSDPKKLRIGETLVIPAHAEHREISSQQAVPATLPNQPSTNPDLVMNK